MVREVILKEKIEKLCQDTTTYPMKEMKHLLLLVCTLLIERVSILLIIPTVVQVLRSQTLWL